MTELSQRLEQLRILVEQGLDQYLPENNCPQKDVFHAAHYSLMAGGKRLRPALLLLCYSMYGENEKQVLPVACALEMIHTYSLIHDDLPCMDDDDLRRGRPSCHIAYGETIALLAGDALLTEAFTTAMQCSVANREALIRAVRYMADRAGIHGMIGGQVIDLQLSGTQCELERLRLMVELKTGALLQAACVCGCLLAGADESDCNAASEYAVALGVAFQAQDDLLDVEGDSEKTGKTPGSDAENEKFSFVAALGIEGCRQLVLSETERACQAARQLPGGELLSRLALSLVGRDH